MPHLSFLRMLSRIPGRGILEAGLAGAFLLLAGCKTPLAEKPTPGEPEAPASERAPLDEAPLSVEKLNLERVTLKPPLRSGPAPAAPALESVYPKRLIPAMAEPDTKFPVRFNFDALSVQDIVPLFAAQLKFNFLIDPAVTGSVTMTLESELTAAELWTLLEHLLALSGAYASPHNGYIQILPVAKMPRESTLFTTAAPQPNVEVAFLPIGHLKSTELLEGLKPFLTENASVTPLPRLGAVMLVDTPVNVARIRELARRLDESSEAGWPLRTVQARHIDADVLREELQQVLPVIGFPVTDKASSDGELKITTIPRLQVLLISAALPEVVAEAARWAEFLDQENATEQEAIFFYNVRHSKADHLSEMLGVFFNTSGATSKSGTAAPSKSKAVSGRAGMKTPAEQETAARPAPAAGKPQGKREVGDKGTVFDAPVVIHADTDQNRLTILTTPRTYAMIEALLQRLDVPPRQVLIQADIANITLSESTKFGFSYAAMQKIGGWNGAWALNNTGAGVPGAATGTAAMALGTNAFAAVFRKDSDKIAFITAVAGDDKTPPPRHPADPRQKRSRSQDQHRPGHPHRQQRRQRRHLHLHLHQHGAQLPVRHHRRHHDRHPPHHRRQ